MSVLPFTRTISAGPNAGQPVPVTDLVLDGLAAVKDVVVKLKRNGFTVISASADANQPVIQVAWHRMLQKLIEAGEAGYYYQNHREKHGEFYGEANDGTKVRIVWVEIKGH